VSKPPKFEGKRGSAYVIWDIKFRSWSGVKGVSWTLNPNFDSKLPSVEGNVLDDTDPIQKAQGIARKQNAIAMDALVQCMSDTDDFHCILQSMHKDVNWPCGKAWKTWKHYQPKDTTSARDLSSALQNIKLKKNVNPIKILSDISAIEVRLKTINDGRNIVVVQGYTGEDYAQVIVIADDLAQIQSSRTSGVTALELCKDMKKGWQLAGHSDDNDEDDDDNNDRVGLETSMGAVKHKQSSIHKKKCFHCGKKGHRWSLCTDKKKKERSEKAGTATDASVKKTRPKCSHCGCSGHT
jgi:hypothetical protein